MRKLILALVLLGCSTARAQISQPLRIMNAGTLLSPQSKLNFVNGGCVVNVAAARIDCTIGGGSTVGLNGAYNGGVVASDNVVLDTLALGTPTFRDNATPLAGGVLNATDSTATKTYLQVSSNGLNSIAPFAFGAVYGSGWYFGENSTPATAGVPAQAAPDYYSRGRVWDGLVSRGVGFVIEELSLITGIAAYSTDLHFRAERAGTFAAIDSLTLSYNGVTHSATFGGTIGPTAAQQHTLPAVASDTFALLAATQTLASKTLTSPIINGATSNSGNFDLSGSFGSLKTPQGAITIGPGSVTVTGQATFSGGAVASGANPFNLSGSTGAWAPTTGGLAANLTFDADNTRGIGNAISNSAAYVASYIYFGRLQTLSGGGAIASNGASGSAIVIQLGGVATTSVNIAGSTGFYQQLVVTVKQDATGGRACPTTWTGVKFPGGTYTVSPGANATDKLLLDWDNAASKYNATVALNLS